MALILYHKIIGREMKIQLTDPYIAYRVSTARQVPLRFQTMAEQIVADLVKAELTHRLSVRRERM